jgi:hypothetical protein
MCKELYNINASEVGIHPKVPEWLGRKWKGIPLDPQFKLHHIILKPATSFRNGEPDKEQDSRSGALESNIA